MSQKPDTEDSSEMPTIRGLAKGQIVFGGRFKLMRLLGEGGMGVVWQALDETLREPVALKFLPPAIRADPTSLEDLRQETIQSRRLSHPNIVKVYDFHEDGGREAFISMEYVEGRTFAQERANAPGRVLSWGFLMPYVLQLCDALEYAHGEKVIHRDLKPSNVLIDVPKNRVKLADFGIARAMSDSVSRVTRLNPSGGTVSYMSCQQLNGEPPCAADDVYSFGATLYELLTSKPPFFSGDIAWQIRYSEPPEISKRLAELNIQNEVPKPVQDAIRLCLDRDPGKRPATAREVADLVGVRDTKRAPGRGAKRGTGRAGRGSAQGGRAVSGSGSVPHGEAAGEAEGPEPGVVSPVPPDPKTTKSLRTPRVQSQTPGREPRPTTRRSASGRPAVETAVPEEESMEPATSAEASVGDRDGVGEGGGLQPREGRGRTSVLLSVVLVLGLAAVAFVAFREGYWPFGGVQAPTTGGEAGGVQVASVPRLPSEGLARVDPPSNAPAAPAPAERPPASPGVVNGVEASRSPLQSPPPAPRVSEPVVEPVSPPPVTPTVVPLSVPAAVESGTRAKADVAPAGTSSAASALRVFPAGQRPWTNSLGMRFAPVRGVGVLFSIWETRVQDYDAFVRAGFLTNESRWRVPKFAASGLHPVTLVGWSNAVAFCAWLTTKEIGEGSLRPGQAYRLPTDLEWSAAAGLTEDASKPPRDRASNRDRFPWGVEWPPKPGSGNYLGGEARRDRAMRGWSVIDRFEDGYPLTAPVGKFAANEHGLHDLGGNLWEWCEDTVTPRAVERVLRGAAWNTANRPELALSYRYSLGPSMRLDHVGFRCVLAVEAPAE